MRINKLLIIGIMAWAGTNICFFVLSYVFSFSLKHDVVIFLKVVNFLTGWLLCAISFFIFAFNFAKMALLGQRDDIPIGLKSTFLILFVNKFLTEEGQKFRNRMVYPFLCFLITLSMLFSLSFLSS